MPTLLQAQRWAGSLAILAAFGACAVSGELGLPFVVGFPLAFAAASMFGDRFYARGDRAWTAILALALFAFAAVVVVGKVDVVLAAARFAVLLAVHRLWSRRTERDEYLLLLLSLLVLCAGAALSAELAFGIVFIAYAIAATWALALTHLRFSIESTRGPEGAVAILRSRRLATPRLLGRLAALSIIGIVGATILFVVFPRISIRALRRGTRASAVAGLTDRIELFGHGTVADDPRIVLRVRLRPDPQVQRLSMHWRARALEVWTGRGWRAREDDALSQIEGLPRRRITGPRWPEQRLVADIEEVAGFTGGTVLTPEGWTTSVEFRRPLTARSTPQRIFRNAADDLFYQPVDGGDLHYVVNALTGRPPLSALRGRGQNYPATVAVDLAVPPDLDPRVRALASRLTEGKDAADAAAIVESWLSTRLRYTRELSSGAKDPIAHFLFERKEGHCELFSSAMVLLLRASGIPARNVTGYYGGERTDADYFAVRAGDAHSWVEVFYPGVGFVQYDPTPPGARGGVAGGTWAGVLLWWDTLQQRWRAFVVDFDLLTQARIVRSALGWMASVGQSLSGRGGSSIRFREGLIGLALLAGAVLGLALVRRARQGTTKNAAHPLGVDERRARELWRKTRRQLARSGVEVRASMSPREIEALVERGARASVSRIVDAYSEARWGGAPLPRATARDLLRDLEAVLAHR